MNRFLFAISIRMQICFVLCFVSLCFSSQGAQEGFQYFNNFYKRTHYEKANFDQLYSDFVNDPEFTTQDYRYTIQKGLLQYFALCDRLDKLRRLQNEDIFPITDQISLDTQSSLGHKNFSFQTAVGVASRSFDNISFIQDETQFEFKWKIYLPLVILKGIANIGGSNKSLEYSMNDIVYLNKQEKKLDGDDNITLSRSSEKFYINSTNWKIDGQPPSETVYAKLQPEFNKDVSKHLASISDYLKVASFNNVTLTMDAEFIVSKNEKIVEKLSNVVSRTVRTFKNITTNIPRFSFYDDDSAINYDLISGVLEVDGEKSNFSITVTAQGDFLVSSPVEGALTFFVTEQNCSESCHTFGNRANLNGISAQVTFIGKRLEKVSMTLDLESTTSVDDHYLRKPSDSVTKSMMTKVTKILNDRLLTRIKQFLK